MSLIISPFFQAIGVISGMIIGSGMFALPYAVKTSGIWWGLLSAIVAFVAILFIHLAYGEIINSSREAHRLPGFVREHFGSFAGNIESIAQIFSFNVTLLVYGILGGKFLHIIANTDKISEWQWTISFFVLCNFIFLFSSIRAIGYLNFLLTVPLICVTLFIAAMALRSGNIQTITGIVGTSPLFSFSVFLFALAGVSVMADARSAFGSSYSPRKFRNAIILGTFIPALLYIFFVIGILSVSGSATSEDVFTGLIPYLGGWIIWLGAVVGFLAVITSYLALGYDLLKIYELDWRASSNSSWMLTAVFPYLLYAAGLTNFIVLMSLVGGFFIVFDGIFIILIARKMRRDGITKEYFLPFGTLMQYTLVLLFIFSATYELLRQIRG